MTLEDLRKFVEQMKDAPAGIEIILQLPTSFLEHNGITQPATYEPISLDSLILDQVVFCDDGGLITLEDTEVYTPVPIDLKEEGDWSEQIDLYLDEDQFREMFCKREAGGLWRI